MYLGARIINSHKWKYMQPKIRVHNAKKMPSKNTGARNTKKRKRWKIKIQVKNSIALGQRAQVKNSDGNILKNIVCM